MEFNDKLIHEVKDQLFNLGIGKVIVTEDQINAINNILELNHKSKDELTAIRNSVVKIFVDEHYDEKTDTVDDEFDKWWNTMSGVVAVIDNAYYSQTHLSEIISDKYHK